MLAVVNGEAASLHKGGVTLAALVGPVASVGALVGVQQALVCKVALADIADKVTLGVP